MTKKQAKNARKENVAKARKCLRVKLLARKRQHNYNKLLFHCSCGATVISRNRFRHEKSSEHKKRIEEEATKQPCDNPKSLFYNHPRDRRVRGKPASASARSLSNRLKGIWECSYCHLRFGNSTTFPNHLPECRDFQERLAVQKYNKSNKDLSLLTNVGLARVASGTIGDLPRYLVRSNVVALFLYSGSPYRHKGGFVKEYVIVDPSANWIDAGSTEKDASIKFGSNTWKSPITKAFLEAYRVRSDANIKTLTEWEYHLRAGYTYRWVVLSMWRGSSTSFPCFKRGSLLLIHRLKYEVQAWGETLYVRADKATSFREFPKNANLSYLDESLRPEEQIAIKYMRKWGDGLLAQRKNKPLLSDSLFRHNKKLDEKAYGPLKGYADPEEYDTTTDADQAGASSYQ